VWNFAHIGNLRAFLFYDLLRRHLQVDGYRMTHVMNITDIDDRILDQAMHAGTTIGDYVKPYLSAFFEDMAALRAQPAERYPRATEHIDQMVAMISTLLEGENAYVAEGDVYFRIASFPAYGALSRLDRAGLRAGTRVAKGGRGQKGSARPPFGGNAPRIRQDKYDKESVSDFALWKKAQPGDEKLGAAWDAPFGLGRPGWHIECSAMSKRYLGDTFDIHCGGIDLMFPHHENEIAQSEAANHKPFARVWLHSEHLAEASGEKMSKSAGGFTTLRDLVAAGHDPLAIRFFLIANAHYRARIRLSSEALHAAAEQVRRLRDFADRLKRSSPSSNQGGVTGAGSARPVTLRGEVPPPIEDELFVERVAAVRSGYQEALDDDLNLPQGIGLVFELIREANAALDEGKVGKDGHAALLALMDEVDAHLDVIGADEPGLAEEVERLIAEREAARVARDFARADRLRDELRERGIALEDSKEGVRWKRVRGPA
jgi:cysteinyl-tRNA synthetase